MDPLHPGLYERVVTELLAGRIDSLGRALDPDLAALRNAEAADRIALHLCHVIEHAIESLTEDERAAVGVDLAHRIVDLIASDERRMSFLNERPVVPAQILRAIRRRRPDGTPEPLDTPLIPLLDTTLLTNSPGEPRVGHQIQTEIASADRIDVVLAFVRRTGIAPLRDQLRKHTQDGRALRVLTTVYTGSTELEALELLQELGADVRVSYDTTSTRLHAKAWLFHRESGFSTAYVGSSNLTHYAQVTGLEWNVRVSGARNRPVIDKIAAVFESYWQQPEFEPFDATQFLEATKRERPAGATLVLSPTEIHPFAFQERLLEQIELARTMGHHRNLLVAATGTGKTVMAAVDYARLRGRLPRARLLFVAHREEILEQSRATFAHALRDASFGERWYKGQRPRDFEHVFASIQSLDAAGLESLAPDHFDVVIVDEFHHAAAPSYARLLDRVTPRELLGLTATPERADGLPILQWFDHRIAAELRLWDAIDQHRLVPFAYYGIADELDLREIPWKRGTGYDVEALTNVITASEVWARYVLKQLAGHVGTVDQVRALGFCVSVRHARFMAEVFARHGVRAVAIWADTPDAERKQALADLAAARVNVVFSVDLFNEGVDVPAVDTLLMLRPTDSPLLFLQQLGRGLRKLEGKTICTVLDFVGHHRKEFRWDRRFRALLGGSRARLAEQVEQGFPFLPAGCHMELDRVASERVLRNIRESVPSLWREKAAELAALAAERPGISLGEFLEATGVELEDVYDSQGRSWTDLREAAGQWEWGVGVHEEVLRRACGRMLHVDDPERLDTWRAWLRSESVPDVESLTVRERRLLAMLLAQMLSQVVSSKSKKKMSVAEGARVLWAHASVREELVEIFDVLAERMAHLTTPLSVLPDVPLDVHARYTRLEILAATSDADSVWMPSWREGVRWVEELPADLFVFTLDKTSGQFSPTTRYRDYAISRELIHWESQSMTTAESPTGRRYRSHVELGSHVLLFARLSAEDRAFHFLGPASYVSHTGERPMAVTWRLEHSLPGDLFQAFAAAVA